MRRRNRSRSQCEGANGGERNEVIAINGNRQSNVIDREAEMRSRVVDRQPVEVDIARTVAAPRVLAMSSCTVVPWLLCAAGVLGACDAGGSGPPDSIPASRNTRPPNRTCKPPASYSQPAKLLSASGCVDTKDPTRPALGLIPYVVASPLWSDGAAKQRFMAIPEGTRVHVIDCEREPDRCRTTGRQVLDDGHFEFPVGTVLMKSFLFQNQLFETRLFMKFREDRWVGYSYRWDADQKDAALVGDDGAVAPATADDGSPRMWSFPSRSDCLLCHNEVVGFSLGPETRQLNVPFTDAVGTTTNQIDRLEALDLFDAPVRRLDPLPDPAGPAPLEARARSYLHANCAICHRPQGNFPDIDLRFGVDLAAMNVCNRDPTKGSAGADPAAAKRLVPGRPDQSVTYTRMATLDGQVRMPQVATAVVDPLGTPLVSDWIKSIPSCP